MGKNKRYYLTVCSRTVWSALLQGTIITPNSNWAVSPITERRRIQSNHESQFPNFFSFSKHYYREYFLPSSQNGAGWHLVSLWFQLLLAQCCYCRHFYSKTRDVTEETISFFKGGSKTLTTRWIRIGLLQSEGWAIEDTERDLEWVKAAANPKNTHGRRRELQIALGPPYVSWYVSASQHPKQFIYKINVIKISKKEREKKLYILLGI